MAPTDACAADDQDGCAVDTEPLQEIVCRFVSTWEKTRPSRGGGQFNGPNGQQAERSICLSALDWLAQETGLPITQLKPLARAPRPPAKRKRKTTRMTELRIADRIVGALEMPDAFHNGTLEIRPNPKAPAALQASCCGGSS